MIWLLGLLGISLPGLAIWAGVLAGLTAIGGGLNAWFGSLDWVTFSILAVCVGLALCFFLIQKPWLLFLVAAALVGAAWSYAFDRGRNEGLELGKQEGIKVLQKLVNVPPDGYLGKETLAAIQKHRDRETADVKQISDLMTTAKQVQAALGVEADGYIGPKTLEAIDKLKAAADQTASMERVKQLQKALGVEADGYVGEQTMVAIEELKKRPAEARAVVPTSPPTAAPPVKRSVTPATKRQAPKAKAVQPWRPCRASESSNPSKSWCPW